ncbi:MAG: hypothetical protein ACLQQ4_16635 [Bacteroidia bacterium]
METKKKNQSNNLPEDKISMEIKSILTAKDEVTKQIESEKKSQDIHFSKGWAIEKELDKVLGTAKEKELKKQITLEKNLRKSHMLKQFSLEKKLVSLKKKHLQKQIALQKILIKRAEQTVAETKKKSDIAYLGKLTKDLKGMESRWETFTEIL